MIFSFYHSFPTSPQGSIKINPDNDRDALKVWSVKRSDRWVPCSWSVGDAWKKGCLGFKNYVENQKPSIRTGVSLGGNNRSYLGKCRGEADPRVPGRGNKMKNLSLMTSF